MGIAIGRNCIYSRTLSVKMADQLIQADLFDQFPELTEDKFKKKLRTEILKIISDRQPGPIEMLEGLEKKLGWRVRCQSTRQ